MLQFKDFLMLYNKLTEMCFNQCTDNFNNRKISDTEVRPVIHSASNYVRNFNCVFSFKSSRPIA